jgi:uncharacterized RDD family membrane protein YckC
MTILDEPFKDENVIYEFAPQLARIINLLIDYFVHSMLMMSLLMLSEWYDPKIKGYWLLFCAPAYYFICEYNFNGKTVGKYFTNTRAIELNGEDLTLKSAALRTLIRTVVVSTFFYYFFISIIACTILGLKLLW